MRPPQICSNSSCGARFSIADSENPEKIAPISRLIFQTYQEEAFEIRPGSPFAPFKCGIEGRLDLFSSAALQKCWLAIPSPRRVLFDLRRTTEVSEPGRAALIALLASKEDDAKASVSLEGVSPQQMALFHQVGPFYCSEANALAALGDVSDTPSWLARII